MNYTIISNAVNLAARLEGVNKQYGTWILASEATIKETENHLVCRRLDRVRVVGISEPVRIYEILDTIEDAPPELHEKVKLFDSALEMFESRRWKDAQAAFNQVREQFPTDHPSLLYLNRCAEFLEKEPDSDWDGVLNITAK